MKKLFIILFLLTVSFRVAAQNEQTKDSTLLNRFPTEMGFPSYPLFRAIFRLWQTKLSERIYESDVSTKPLRCSHGSENQ